MERLTLTPTAMMHVPCVCPQCGDRVNMLLNTLWKCEVCGTVSRSGDDLTGNLWTRPNHGSRAMDIVNLQSRISSIGRIRHGVRCDDEHPSPFIGIPAVEFDHRLPCAECSDPGTQLNGFVNVSVTYAIFDRRGCTIGLIPMWISQVAADQVRDLWSIVR